MLEVLLFVLRMLRHRRRLRLSRDFNLLLQMQLQADHLVAWVGRRTKKIRLSWISTRVGFSRNTKPRDSSLRRIFPCKPATRNAESSRLASFVIIFIHDSSLNNTYLRFLSILRRHCEFLLCLGLARRRKYLQSELLRLHSLHLEENLLKSLDIPRR